MPKPARGKRDEQTRPARRRAQDAEPKKRQRTASKNTRAPRNPARTRDLDTNKEPKGDEERRPTVDSGGLFESSPRFTPEDLLIH